MHRRTRSGLEARRTIDPDEAVAIGAAIQAGIMDGAIQGLEVLSPLQAALLRGFARKKLAEEQGTYTPLMGDPDADLEEDDAEDWFVCASACMLVSSLPRSMLSCARCVQLRGGHVPLSFLLSLPRAAVALHKRWSERVCTWQERR